MKEKIIIGLVTMVIGIAATTLGFLIYQQSKSKAPQPKKEISISSQKDTLGQNNGLALSITQPIDEAIVDKRTIQVKGKTIEGMHTVIVSTNQEDVSGITSKDGNFSLSVTINSGVNKITTRIITDTGEEMTDERIVTYSTEEF